MRLLRYRVTNFRSVTDSGWIDVDDVTALIGVNESGKSNLLAPLWKLNPAREGEVKPTADYPKSEFGAIRADPKDFCFVEADFATGTFASRLASAAGVTAEQAGIVRVRRYFDSHYDVSFPGHDKADAVSASDVAPLLERAADEVAALTPLKQEEGRKPEVVAELKRIALDLPDVLDADRVSDLVDEVRAIIPDQPAKTSSIFPRLEALVAEIEGLHTSITAPAPGTIAEVKAAVLKRLPKFVYYSNYGNLDSEIYLPHVVQNLSRDDLGEKEAAKARTLRVLFSFVRLQPDEILELGQDFQSRTGRQREPTAEEIAEIADKKRERSILLQSAGVTLTKRFKEWWKQGDYRFRFEADGDHFRIWVSDDRRPDEVELESRSTGLQWFLSFYLVFLVESESSGEHDNAILLLDEPGLSLHPLAQYDLSKFFDNLSGTNQLLYTTHSPFLVHADRLDRARKVYVSADGTTKATADLRQGTDQHPGASYAVHSALGLSVADSLMLGCQPVIVEGSSDQHYLTAIKTLLIASGRLRPARELVFPPAGGAKNTKMVASILSGRDETLPFMILDGDAMGRQLAKDVASNLYQDAKDRLILVDHHSGMSGSEIEDLLPPDIISAAVDRLFRTADVPFADVVATGKPIVGQIEVWAKEQKVELTTGWKVDLSKRVKQTLLASGVDKLADDYVARWEKLFAAFGVASEPSA